MSNTYGENIETMLSRKERFLWALVGAVFIGDFASTLVGLHIGMSEGNPIVEFVLIEIGSIGFFALKLSIVLMGVTALTFITDKLARLVIPLGIFIPWFVATILNTIQIMIVL